MPFAFSLLPSVIPYMFCSSAALKTAHPKHHPKTLSIFLEIIEKLNPHLMKQKNHEKLAVCVWWWSV
jgi:hypothetical protein